MNGLIRTIASAINGYVIGVIFIVAKFVEKAVKSIKCFNEKNAVSIIAVAPRLPISANWNVCFLFFRWMGKKKDSLNEIFVIYATAITGIMMWLKILKIRPIP